MGNSQCNRSTNSSILAPLYPECNAKCKFEVYRKDNARMPPSRSGPERFNRWISMFQDTNIPARGGRQWRQLVETTPSPTGIKGLQGDEDKETLEKYKLTNQVFEVLLLHSYTSLVFCVEESNPWSHIRQRHQELFYNLMGQFVASSLLGYIVLPADLLPDGMPVPRDNVRRILHELVVRHEPKRTLGIPGEARHPQGGQCEPRNIQGGPSP